MNKADIYVLIDSEKKRLAAIDILERAGESLYHRSQLFWEFDKKLYLHYDIHGADWFAVSTKISKRKVPLNKLADLLYVFAEIEEKKPKKTNDTKISTMETNLEPTQESQPFYMVFVENSASAPTVKHEKYADAHAEMLRLSKKQAQKAYVLLTVSQVEQVPKITSFGIPPHI